MLAQRLTLFVENACSQLVTFGPDGLPVTSQSGSEHGLGLRSVQGVVRAGGYPGPVPRHPLRPVPGGGAVRPAGGTAALGLRTLPAGYPHPLQQRRSRTITMHTTFWGIKKALPAIIRQGG